MSIYKDILKKYWGYPDFRPLQEDIIRSVADEGKDTLGLLPTGGGKSIIFQVPALAKEGVCLVISPLIALMKDQVENLAKRNIPAAAIYTGMSKNEILFNFQKAINNEIKFLYLSPERLMTEAFLTNLPQMNVNLLAIDESHCISQWGYDFRPSYLKIANIRKYIPEVPVLALTATATPEVVEDIQEKLNFKQKNVFRKSFKRDNLVYIVKKTHDKYGRMLKLINAVPGTGIVYARSRKLTEKIALFLQKNKISADFYHAGLSAKEKDQKQDAWKNDRTRIIVATNAFGMGIDKPDVRFVIHIDLPDSLEAYFQEAGRGGRDLKDAYAFLLYDDEDITNLRNSLKRSFPEKETIAKVYQAMCSFLNVPYETGQSRSFDFVFTKFVEQYNLPVLETYNSLKFIQNEGLIEYTEEITEKSKLHFIASKDVIYKFQVENPKYDSFIKFLLRTYGGLFSDYVNINEYKLASKARVAPKVIFEYLSKLHKHQIVDYIPQKQTPYITFLQDRQKAEQFRLSPETYDWLKETYQKKIEAVIKYVTTTDQCRSSLLLEYFGEFQTEACGRCDYCKKKEKVNEKIREQLRHQIIEVLMKEQMTTQQLLEKFPDKQEDVSECLKILLDNDTLILDSERKLRLK